MINWGFVNVETLTTPRQHFYDSFRVFWGPLPLYAFIISVVSRWNPIDARA